MWSWTSQCEYTFMSLCRHVVVMVQGLWTSIVEQMSRATMRLWTWHGRRMIDTHARVWTLWTRAAMAPASTAHFEHLTPYEGFQQVPATRAATRFPPWATHPTLCEPRSCPCPPGPRSTWCWRAPGSKPWRPWWEILWRCCSRRLAIRRMFACCEPHRMMTLTSPLWSFGRSIHACIPSCGMGIISLDSNAITSAPMKRYPHTWGNQTFDMCCTLDKQIWKNKAYRKRQFLKECNVNCELKSDIFPCLR